MFYEKTPCRFANLTIATICLQKNYGNLEYRIEINSSRHPGDSEISLFLILKGVTGYVR